MEFHTACVSDTLLFQHTYYKIQHSYRPIIWCRSFLSFLVFLET